MADEELKPQWDLAVDRIQQAQAVVFLGYRFPPSDAHARGTILDAIRRNTNAVHLVTVLGDDGFAATRLHSLLAHVVRKTSAIETSPLFVEDYLSVFDRAAL